MTKMATTHAQMVLQAMYPERRSCNFEMVTAVRADGYHLEYLMPSAEKSIWTVSENDRGGYAWRLAMGETELLNEADIFCESYDEESLVWGDSILSALNPDTTIVLNRNLLDWLCSYMRFFGEGRKRPYVKWLKIFFQKNLFYERLSKYNFRTINVSQENLDVALYEHFSGGENARTWDLDFLKENRQNIGQKEIKPEDREIVKRFLTHLNITYDEMELPFIERLT